MSDPFRSNSNPQLIREAQFGLSVVTVLLVVFVYVAYHRIVGNGHQIPEHIRNAAVAKVIREPFVEQPAVVSANPSESKPIRPVVVQSPSEQLTSRQASQWFGATGINKSLSEPKPQGIRIAQLPTSPTVNSEVAAQKTTAPVSPLGATRETETSFAQNKSNPISSNSFDSLPITKNELRAEPPVRNQVQPKIKLVSNESQSQDFAPLSNQPISKKGDLASDFQPLDNKAPKTPVVKTDSASQPKRIPALPKATNDFAPLVTKPVEPSTPKHFTPAKLEPKKNLLPTLPKIPATTSSSKSSLESEFQYTAAAHVKNDGLKPTMTCPKPMPNERQETEIKTQAVNLDLEPKPQPEIPNSPVTESSSRIYVAQLGDSFWSIAQQKYGDGRFFRALYRYNKTTITDFNSIPAGARIETPDAQDLVKLWPDLCPKPEAPGVPDAQVNTTDRVYITKDGDTLFDIARQQLGQASRFADIHSVNHQQLNSSVAPMSELKSGLRLVLPKQ